ncbi:hypothetical protein QCA50_018596 [Cerrena zonata]|uniref:Uncharacterized protein n=1 Tax=Cerrena zonata TaxID=2478898 RepID=A0AAW0FD27_9APHY
MSSFGKRIQLKINIILNGNSKTLPKIKNSQQQQQQQQQQPQPPQQQQPPQPKVNLPLNSNNSLFNFNQNMNANVPHIQQQPPPPPPINTSHHHQNSQNQFGYFNQPNQAQNYVFGGVNKNFIPSQNGFNSEPNSSLNTPIIGYPPTTNLHVTNSIASGSKAPVSNSQSNTNNNMTSNEFMINTHGDYPTLFDNGFKNMTPPPPPPTFLQQQQHHQNAYTQNQSYQQQQQKHQYNIINQGQYQVPSGLNYYQG